MRILVVEDEERLAELIRAYLSENGYAVDVVHDGKDAINWLASTQFDAIVLDIMLPGVSGLDVCRRLRSWKDPTPVLMLTARDQIDDRIEGLDAGSDDYLVKPFAMAELTARLRALLRRPAIVLSPVLEQAGIRLDPASRRVWVRDDEMSLPNKQFMMLEYFLRNPGQVLTRTMIADHLWDYDFGNESNVIDVHIRQIRKRIDVPGSVSLIETVRGVGYRLVVAR